MMLPLVTLQLTPTLAESPVLVNPTAVKSVVAFSRSVSVFGETTRSAMEPPPLQSRAYVVSQPLIITKTSTPPPRQHRRRCHCRPRCLPEDAHEIGRAHV